MNEQTLDTAANAWSLKYSYPSKNQDKQVVHSKRAMDHFNEGIFYMFVYKFKMATTMVQCSGVNHNENFDYLLELLRN